MVLEFVLHLIAAVKALTVDVGIGLYKLVIARYFLANKFNSFYRGKTVLVTGASSGIGKELARVLACSNARVIIIAGRDKTKLDELSKFLTTINPNTAVIIWEIDLEKYIDIEAKYNNSLRLLLNDKNINSIDILMYRHYDSNGNRLDEPFRLP
jgi:hypothetical protein